MPPHRISFDVRGGGWGAIIVAQSTGRRGVRDTPPDFDQCTDRDASCGVGRGALS